MRLIASCTEPMINTPTSTPEIVATPPVSETPPSTQADITPSSSPTDVLGSPRLIRDASMTPAKPVTSPCSTNTVILMRMTGRPASNAASLLPPTARTFFPNTVFFSRKPNSKKPTMFDHIGKEIPRNDPPPRSKKRSSEIITASPFDVMYASPRTTSIMASVTISELIFQRAISTPFTSPTAPPASTPPAIPSVTLCVDVISVDATTPANATMDATDKSTSPSASTNIMVTEIEPINVTDNSKPWILRELTNPGTVKASVTNRITNTMTMPDLLMRSQVRAARARAPVL